MIPHPAARRTLTTLGRALAVLAVLVLAAPARAPARAAAGMFVGVQGAHLVAGDRRVRLKGVSFYPSKQPWADMWKRWDGPATQADLARLGDFGSNTVRVLLPYRADLGITDDSGAARPVILDRLRQLVQMAGQMNVKVILTLFDWYDDTPAVDDPRWQQNLTYLHSLTDAFAADDRVLGWDLHNEPDVYGSWMERPAAAIDWLLRVGAELHQRAPHQLVTVGVAHAASLWQADPQGRTLLDVSDFASFHSYDAAAISGEIAAVRAHTSKPVVLEEAGWPTGPCGMDPMFNETQQVVLYREALAAATAGDLDGVLAWVLWDFPPDSSAGGGVESEQDHFGLLRLDGSPKPAAALFRDGFAAAGLPSATTSALPLTVAPPPPPVSHPPGWLPPLSFPETGHTVWSEFRDYWRQFGGLLIFGYPLSEARFESGRKVQYFERARFEWHPENAHLPGYDALGKTDKLRLLVQLTRLGAPLADAHHWAPGAAPSAGSAALWFPQTQHTLQGTFKQFWQDHAGLTNFGYPLSEELREVSALDGQTYTVQYFERARFEYHPEHAGTPFAVLLGQLGTEMLAARGCR